MTLKKCPILYRDAFFQTGCDPARDEQLQQKQRRKSIFGTQVTAQSEETQKPDIEIVDDARYMLHHQ